MQVLGIDPSLRCTGVATVGEAGMVFPSRVPTMSMETLTGQRDLVRYIVGSVLAFAPATNLLTVIERPYVPQGQGGAGSLIERAWLFGMLVDQLMLRGPVVDVRPSLRAKYAAHNGNADKAAVKAAIRDAYPNVRVRDDNEADAIALAAMGARFLGMPIDGTPSKAQEQAMTAVHWPTPEEMK
jgi:Holliday junction resolvasome RuvABC endonuclease subunit